MRVVTSGVVFGLVISCAAFARLGAERAGLEPGTQQVETPLSRFGPSSPQFLATDAVPDLVVAPESGRAPVRVLSGADGFEIASGFPFGADFAGGVRVAVGDVNGDGVPDIVTAMGPGGGLVRLFSGVDAADLGSGHPFGSGFAGGVSVAVGDVNADGRLDILTAQESGGGQVRIFSGVDLSSLGAPTPFGAGYTGGIHVAAGDVNGDGAADVVVAQAAGGLVSVLNGRDLTGLGGGYPFGPGGVVHVAVGDVNGDGTGEVLVAPGAGDGPVQIYQLSPLALLASLTPFPGGSSGGVRVATLDLDGDGRVEVVTAAGRGGAPLLHVYRGGTFSRYAVALAYNAGFVGGVVAAGPASSTRVRFTSAATATFTVGQPGTFTVRTAGSPTVTSLTRTGTLPAGVAFTDNRDGTATLSGTPTGSGGTFALTFTATNGVSPAVTQSFVLTVQQAPTITSSAVRTFPLGVASAFTVTTTGFPAPTLSVTGALPTGVTFVDNGDGTATLAGTPASGTGGAYPLSLTATNGVGGAATQAFVLTVDASPAFTSATATTFSVGSAGTFTVTTVATPTVTAITQTGTLPAGVTFADLGNGTATIAGAPAGGTGGTYPLTLTATNGVGTPSVQTFTLTVAQGLAITSAAAATFTVGAPGSFTVTTSGFPAPSVSASGALPSGVALTDNGNGTATLAGTPTAGTGGVYALTITASNGVGAPATQGFALTVQQAPAITSAAATTVAVGSAGSFTVTTTGVPVATITLSGVLPGGVTFVDTGTGTATLAGTPAAGTGGTYALTITAANGVGTAAVQSFTLTVTAPPAITSAALTTFTVGTAGTFTVATSGFPAPTLTLTGALPAGVTFVDSGTGTASLAGTPASGTGGSYALTITAANGIGSAAVQTFTLAVTQAPAFTSAASTTFLIGTPGTFTVTTSGEPAVTAIARTGAALPSGVTYLDNGNGTATLSGTPAAGTGGAYALVFTITNGVGGNVVQNFMLSVQQAPAITSAATDTFVVGSADSFTITTTGFPTPTVSSAGTLPTGVTLVGNALGGTATQTGTFPLQLTATNGVSPDALQNFTLTIACPAITVNPSSLADGLFGTAYGPATFTQTGSTGSTFTWAATGLPTGLSLSTAGVLSGTPTNTALNASVAVTVTDTFGCQGTRTVTLTVRPNPDNESYTGGVGHTQYVVGAAAPATPHVFVADTVLTGDQGPAPLTSVVATGPSNGSMTLASNGTFTYTPNLNFAGPTDSFTYTLTDGNGVTNTATVTIALSNLVWYVNSGGSNGDGRAHTPFNALANAAAPSASGSTIYVHTGGATTPGNLAMDASQVLWGQGVVFTLNNLTIPAGTAPTLTGTVTLANNSSVNAVAMTPTGQALVASGVTQPVIVNQVAVTGGTNALSLTNVTGSVTVTGGSFSNGSGAEVLISGGSGTVSVGASIANNAGRSIDIQNRTGGTVAFTGAIADTAQGILLNANTGSTIAFSGGLALSTGANPAFTATGGGTVTATQNNTTIVNTIATTTATALAITNTNIGAGGLTFRSISAGTGTASAGNGIVLDTTGVGAGNGGLTVSGNGTAGSGGTIQQKSGADGTTTEGIGIYLNNTRSAAFNRMSISNHTNFAIRGFGVAGFVLADSTIAGTNGTNASGLFSEGSMSFTELTGVATISTSSVSGGVTDNVRVVNSSGTLNRLTFSGATIGAQAAGGGNDGILLEATGTAVFNVTVQNSTFTAAAGDLFNYILNGANTGDLVFTGNTLSNNHPAIATGGGGVTIVSGNNVGAGANFTFNIANNTFRDSVGTAVLIAKSTDPGTVTGRFDSNQLGVAAVADSGSLEGSGLKLQNLGLGTMTVAVTNNQIRQYNNFGIEVLTGGSASPMSGAMNVTVTGNTVETPGTNPATSAFPKNGLHVNAGTVPGDTYQVCMGVSGNALASSGSEDSPGVGTDFRMRQRQATTVRLPGYSGPTTDNTAVVSFVQGNNGGSPSGLASNTVPTGGGFVGGAACPTPP